MQLADGLSKGNMRCEHRELVIIFVSEFQTAGSTNRTLYLSFRASQVYNTGCPRRNGQNVGRVFLMLNYTDITQNTYIQS